jgi:hypothetical protein
MDCSTTRDFLLQAEHPTRLEDVPPELAAHVETCPSCRRLADRLERFEQRYRDELPLATAKAIPAVSPIRRPHTRWPLRRLAVAASILLAVGVLTWSLLPQAQAAPDVLERLIDWNLDLTQAQAPQERQRICNERAAELEAAIEQADLRTEDRDFAVALLDGGSWLAGNDDPAAEADHFNKLADELVAQIDAATTKKDAKRLRKLAVFYRRIARQGVHANLQRAEQSGVLDFQRKRKIERVILRDAERADKLLELLESAPNATRKEIRRALDLRGKPPGPRKPGKDR